MFAPDQYQLLDFGAGRKLERFANTVIDRPSPAAEGCKVAHADLWETATARFINERPGGGVGSKGAWEEHFGRSSSEAGEPWVVRHGAAAFEMKLGASGNVGLFPEQDTNWDWIGDQITVLRATAPNDPPRVLNLFAYTGGASLAAALAGAEVTHVDSSGPTVAWAKANAATSGVAHLPIKWLVEDAMKFVGREVRRGNRYDGIIADPPTYGHGPKGKPFKFRKHLDALMEMCGELINPNPAAGQFLLFSCHALGFGLADAISTVSSVVPEHAAGRVTGHNMCLTAGDGRTLDAGIAARWTAVTTS